MTEMNEIYKCNICGNIVEMTHGGAGELVCCGEPMKLQDEKTEEEGNEKHVPVVEQGESKVKVKVGEVPHPMEDAHYIEWIEFVADGKVLRKHLKPGAAPEVSFCKQPEGSKVRAYCNVHGLWKGK